LGFWGQRRAEDENIGVDDFAGFIHTSSLNVLAIPE
jgi:hypothetical protein